MKWNAKKSRLFCIPVDNSRIFIKDIFYKRLNCEKNNMYGTVIILNGPSVAGKSSIQKEFQNLMMQEDKLWLKLGIDSLFDHPMPDITLENIEYWQSKNPIRWVETSIYICT